MRPMTATSDSYFAPVDQALQAWIDREQLPGVSYEVLHGGSVVARKCLGWADREASVPLRDDHLFRIFSNTKLVTSCAALQLLEQGRFGADDPIGEYIPALAKLRVLRAGATSVDDTEPASEPVRIRHLLTHTAGFTYGFLQPDAPIAKAYAAAGILDESRDLAQMMEALGTLPLLFQPGSAWNYSVATDVVGRLVEVASGERLDAYFQRNIFEPLGMRDTFFVVPPTRADRLVAMYMGSLREPARPGLRRVDHLPYEGAYRQAVPRLNAGGGLVSSLADYTQFVRTLLQGGGPLLKPATMPLLLDNQLAPGQWIGCPGIPFVEGRGHSFGGSVTVRAHASDPSSAQGDVQWGGLAGTKWMFSPREDIAMVLMTQRYMASDLPFWPEFKRLVREALAASGRTGRPAGD
jgi:CubicO group peptidase (beta-lactamase class C family)